MLRITFDKHWEWKMMHEEHISKEELSVKEKNFEEWVLNIMEALAANHYSKVTFYPYRTAQIVTPCVRWSTCLLSKQV